MRRLVVIISAFRKQNIYNVGNNMSYWNKTWYTEFAKAGSLTSISQATVQ